MSRYCECGCGQITKVVHRKSNRFIHGHNTRDNQKDRYILIWVDTDEGRKQVKEHILMAEKAIGKKLPVLSVIHHVDERRSNNSPHNLVICQDRNYHSLLHERTKAYHATGNPRSIRCRHCKIWGMLSSSGGNIHVSIGNGRPYYYHRECAARQQREREAVGRVN